MTQEISTWVESYDRGVFDALSSCEPAKDLYQQTLKIYRDNPIALKIRLEEELPGVLATLSKHEKVDRLVYALATIAIKASNSPYTLTNWLDKYEYPQGKKWYDSLFFWRVHENELPECQFNSATPLARERFVVCHQMIYYFAELITGKILPSCKIVSSSYQQISYKLNNLGSYLVYSESPKETIPTRNPSSWQLRMKWNELMRDSFCQKKIESVWHSTLCNEMQEEFTDQSPTNWYYSIFKNGYMNGDTYSSIVADEVRAEFASLNEALNHHQFRSAVLAPKLLDDVSAFSTKTDHLHKFSTAVQKLMNLYEQFLTARSAYEKSPTFINWKLLQEMIEKVKDVMDQNQFNEKYSFITHDIKMAKQFQKPNHNLEL